MRKIINGHVVKLDIFDYFWNTFNDFFKKYSCTDDYTIVDITEDNILYFDTYRWPMELVDDYKDSDDMIKDFDTLIKETFGDIKKIKVQKINENRIIIEYQITDEIRDSICVLSALKGYKVETSDDIL